MSARATSATYLRTFIFGVEDSLVSTVGLLSGVAIAGLAREDIFLTGVVLIFVEAVSMTAGSFLSETSAEEYEKQSSSRQSYGVAFVMFVSYFVSGFVPLLPYVVLPVSSAFASSIIVSLGALALLGYAGARITGAKRVKSILRMTLVGGAAILVGIVAGSLLK